MPWLDHVDLAAPCMTPSGAASEALQPYDVLCASCLGSYRRSRSSAPARRPGVSLVARSGRLRGPPPPRPRRPGAGLCGGRSAPGSWAVARMRCRRRRRRRRRSHRDAGAVRAGALGGGLRRAVVGARARVVAMRSCPLLILLRPRTRAGPGCRGGGSCSASGESRNRSGARVAFFGIRARKGCARLGGSGPAKRRAACSKAWCPIRDPLDRPRRVGRRSGGCRGRGHRNGCFDVALHARPGSAMVRRLAVSRPGRAPPSAPLGQRRRSRAPPSLGQPLDRPASSGWRTRSPTRTNGRRARTRPAPRVCARARSGSR